MEVKILLTATLLCIVQVAGYLNTYRGAVVEYHPEILGTEDEVVAKNVENYKTFIIEAKSKNAQIIVFPEMGLATKKMASPIPDPADYVIPCENDKFTTTNAVKDLSCAARDNKIYTVINLLEKRKCDPDDENCPKEGHYLYNTNVVFDRHGAVIARYAKYNLYDEKDINRTPDPELVFFDTDFGVRFGTFICFDILFQTPTLRLVQQFGIADFISTTYWFSELPFLTALQAQRGWAEANNVNLLVSGVNMVNTGSTGSGIYNGKYGALAQLQSDTTRNKLLVADIPKIESSRSCDLRKANASEIFTPKQVPKSFVTRPRTSEQLYLKGDDMNRFSTEIIETNKPFQKVVCRGKDFCCNFNVNVESLKTEAKDYIYRAVVFNGVRRFGNEFKGGVQACGVVLCNGRHIDNCTSRVQKIPGLFYINDIRIRGNFKSRNAFQMPSTLTDGKRLEPLSANKYEFINTEKDGSNEVRMELLWPVTNLHTFAIWGRDFSRDNEIERPISGSSLMTAVPCLLVSLMMFVFLAS